MKNRINKFFKISGVFLLLLLPVANGAARADKGQTISQLKEMIQEGRLKEAEKTVLGLLKKSARVGDEENRIAALNSISSHATERFYIDLLKYMQKAPVEVKVDILNWIAKEAEDTDKKRQLKELELRFDLTANQAISEQLQKGTKEVKAAAGWALSKIGNEASIPVLVSLLTNDDEDLIFLGREVLFVFEGNIVTPVARVIPNATDPGKIAGVEILAARKANSHVNTVLELIRSGSPEVKIAAYKALKNVVGYKNFVFVCGMLESSDPEYISFLQEAVISAISSLPVEEQREVVRNRMIQAGEGSRPLYSKVLASIGVEDNFY